MKTRMDMIVKLIHILDDKTASDEYKLKEICYCRDQGVITDEEGVDLVTAYSIWVPKWVTDKWDK